MPTSSPQVSVFERSLRTMSTHSVLKPHLSELSIRPGENWYKSKLYLPQYEINRLRCPDHLDLFVAMIRKNRLLDEFLGISVLSNRSNTRTKLLRPGSHVVKVLTGHTRSGKEHLVLIHEVDFNAGIHPLRIRETLRAAALRFPDLIARPVGVARRFGDCDSELALIEFDLIGSSVCIRGERHFELQPNPLNK